MKRISSKAAITIAAATLWVGYADLWRGGETISAIMLTVGYVILVPIAIVTARRENRTQEKSPYTTIAVTLPEQRRN